MISADGWFDWAERVPGHYLKVNGGVNLNRGMFLHSADGYEAYLRSNPPLHPSIGGQKSWHLTNLLSGKLLQHYSLNAQCWHATAANNSFAGMEHEGLSPREPSLNAAQIATSKRVIAEASQHYLWTPRRLTSSADRTYTLWEHNEVVKLGGSYSACPSGRIPWDLILEEEAEETMIPHNWIADWFDGQRLHAMPPDQYLVMQAQADFNLPDDAREVVFAVYIDEGEAKWFHGLTAREAGHAGARGVNYLIIRATMGLRRTGTGDRGKTLNFRPEGDCIIGRVFCLGYLR